MTIHVKSGTVSVRESREDTCQHVLKEFQEDLPGLPFLCFIDDEDSQEMKDALGHTNRALHLVLKRHDSLPVFRRLPLPDYVESVLKDPISGKRTVEVLIYLHGSTSAVEASMVISLAHEVQHLLQYGNARKLWAVDGLIRDLARSGQILGFSNWQDHPSEHQAILTSKRIAAKLCGLDSVERYADSQINQAPDSGERARWEFFRGLPLDGSYNFPAEVIKLVEVYRGALQDFISQYRRNDPICSSLDFGRSDWWKE